MNGKLIIIEGADECGKSTLAKILARALNGVALHSTATPALFSALPDYHNNIMENVENNVELGRTVILDRFWPSEMAYGVNLFRPNSGYAEVADALHQRIIKLDYLYIFAFSYSGWNRYKKGHTDPAHSLTEEQYATIYKFYIKHFEQIKQLGVTCIPYILEVDGVNDINMISFIRSVKNLLRIQ